MKTQTAGTTETIFTSPDLAERTLHRRAVEAVIWGMPIVSFDTMRQAFLRDAGARYGYLLLLKAARPPGKLSDGRSFAP